MKSILPYSFLHPAIPENPEPRRWRRNLFDEAKQEACVPAQLDPSFGGRRLYTMLRQSNPTVWRPFECSQAGYFVQPTSHPKSSLPLPAEMTAHMPIHLVEASSAVACGLCSGLICSFVCMHRRHADVTILETALVSLCGARPRAVGSLQVAGYWAAMIDLTHPLAREWTKDFLRSEMLRSGSSVR